MSASNTTLYQSSNSSTSTLRPRNARLISFIDDGSDSNTATGTATSSGSSKAPPLFPSRGSSPSHGVGRTRSLNQGRRSESGQNHVRKTSDGGPSAPSTDIWSSWSSIASSLLGTDSTPSKGKGKGAYKQPRWMKQDKSYASSPTSPHWGPNVEITPSAISEPLEERQALLQAKKREALLKPSVAESQDMSGRYKRRDSNAYTRDDNSEDDALVYIHKIKKDDTMAGVMLKYGCQPDVFRKVNRFWPNDNIQTRRHVFLPVEACSVRGKKVDEPDDLLGSALENLRMQDTTSTANQASLSDSYKGEFTASPTHSETSRSVSNAEELGFNHDSWVSVPSFLNPIEILRMPRKSLGYFPRARRKSLIVSDTSTASTPKSSFDTLRHPPTHAAQVSLSLNASPVRRPVLQQRSSRQRSSSVTATQNSFVDALRGPGGVGTLRGLRTEPSRPGPAEDALNRKFAQYFPDIAAPTLAPLSEDNLPRVFLSASSRATPRASTDSVRSHRSNSNSSGLGEVGGAIEGFVRKLAGNKSKPLTSGAARMGDLIELETNSVNGSDLGEDGEGEGDAQATPTAASMNVARQGQTVEDLLNERFPVRGRGVSAYGLGTGVGKDKGD